MLCRLQCQPKHDYNLNYIQYSESFIVPRYLTQIEVIAPSVIDVWWYNNSYLFHAVNLRLCLRLY